MPAQYYVWGDTWPFRAWLLEGEEPGSGTAYWDVSTLDPNTGELLKVVWGFDPSRWNTTAQVSNSVSKSVSKSISK